MISDRELATRVAVSGDQRAFTLLVDRHQAAIRNYLRRLMVGDNAAADDLAQETFLTVFLKMSSWQGTAKLSTWIHTIAYRKFLDYQRKHKRQSIMAEVPDTGHDSRQALEDEILARHLMGLLQPRERAMMTLSYGAGMSHAEIADITGQPLGSVKARIHRARLKLNKWLKSNDHSIQTKTTKQGSAAEKRHAR
jgi:RNA polymerase sigma-70 factor (ECF subfamily)